MSDLSVDHDRITEQRGVRVAAYALCQRGDEVLVVRASAQTEVQGAWFLPGGGIDFGERPEDAVLRELTEETGLSGRDPRLLAVFSDVHRRRSGTVLFSVRIVYEVDELVGELTAERNGTSDEVCWAKRDELAAMGATPYVLAAVERSSAK